MKIPIAKHEITKKDCQAVEKTLKSSYIACGPKIKEFEEKISKYVNRKYGVAVSSGTAALHIIIRSLGIKKGDEVITSPFSFIASSNCILFEGAKPVFVDIDPITRNIDPRKIEKRITKKTKAILAIDIFGQTADWGPILKIAKKYKLKIIEDSCEALGSEYKNRKCGSFGDASAFAFFPNKQITTGEGGMIVTDNEKIYKMALSLRNQGRSADPKWLKYERLGFNYRISDINCALGISQFERIESIIKRRQRVVDTYNKYLSKIKKIRIPQRAKYANKINWMHYTIEIDDSYSKKDRDNIMKKLRENGIGCREYFPSIHLFSFYKKMFNYKKGDCPISEKISDHVISLPMFNALTERQISYITKTLKNIIL